MKKLNDYWMIYLFGAGTGIIVIVLGDFIFKTFNMLSALITGVLCFLVALILRYKDKRKK